MSVLPHLPFPKSKLPSDIAFIVPFPEECENITQFFNKRYELIAAYDHSKDDMLDPEELKDVKPYFDVNAADDTAKVITPDFKPAPQLKSAFG